MTNYTTLRTALVAAAVAGAFACAPGYARDEGGAMHGGVNTPTPGGNNVVGQQPYGPPGGAIGNPPGAPFATQDRDQDMQRRHSEMQRRHDEMVGGTSGSAGAGQMGHDDRPGISPAQRGVKTPSYGGNARTPEPAPNAGPSTAVQPRDVPTPGGNNVVGQNPYGPPGGAVANPPGSPMYQGGTTGGAASGTSGTAGKVETPMAGGNNAGHGVNKQ